MNNGYIEDLRKQVKKALKEDKMRYRHTLGVADTSASLPCDMAWICRKLILQGFCTTVQNVSRIRSS